MTAIIGMLIISRRGKFVKLYLEQMLISQQCLSGSCSGLCVVRDTTPGPRKKNFFLMPHAYKV